MLDDADVAVAQPFGFLDQIERLAKIVGTGFLLGPDIGKKLHAELHCGDPGQRTARSRTAAPNEACGCDGNIRSRRSRARTQPRLLA